MDLRLKQIAPPVLWLSLCWAHSFLFPRPFDDAKDCLFYLIAGIALASVSLRKIKTTPVVIVTFAYLVVCGLTFGTAFYEAFLAMIRVVLWCGFAYSLVFLDWKLVAKLSVVSAGGIALLSILSVPWVLGWPWPWDKYMFYPVGHSSYYGVFMALHIPLAIYFISETKRWWWWPLLGLLFVGLFMSASRAAVLGTVVGVGFPVFLSVVAERSKARIVIAGLIVPLLVVGILYFSGNKSERQLLKPLISKFETQRPGGLVPPGRKYTWKATLEMISEMPVLGHGIGNYRFAYPEYGHESGTARRWIYHPHNELLHQASEVGIVGMVIWVAGIVCLYLTGFIGLTKDRDPAAVALGLCGLTVLFVAWQFDTTYLNALIRAMAAFYASLIIRRVVI